jgi:hypothetical protein
VRRLAASHYARLLGNRYVAYKIQTVPSQGSAPGCPAEPRRLRSPSGSARTGSRPKIVEVALSEIRLAMPESISLQGSWERRHAAVRNAGERDGGDMGARRWEDRVRALRVGRRRCGILPLAPGKAASAGLVSSSIRSPAATVAPRTSASKAPKRAVFIDASRFIFSPLLPFSWWGGRKGEDPRPLM